MINPKFIKLTDTDDNQLLVQVGLIIAIEDNGVLEARIILKDTPLQFYVQESIEEIQSLIMGITKAKTNG